MAQLPPVIGNEDIGFQIAPMIDVVFVIMLFFMVKSATSQKETELHSQFPSSWTPTQPAGLAALEQTVAIDEQGCISHNDEPLPCDASRTDLQTLRARMRELGQSAEDTQRKVLVTVTTSPDTKYEDLITVMNALESARIHEVTFALAEE